MYYLLRCPITLAVMLVCAVCFYLQSTNNTIIRKYSYQFFRIQQGEYYRFLTGGFLHGGAWHLLMNMYSLYNLGTFLEPFLGSVRFAILLVGAIIVGNVFCYLLNVHSAIGLSGGLYGLMMLYICMLLRYSSISLITILRFNIANILLNFMPGIAWQAHVGGGVFGILMSFLLLH